MRPALSICVPTHDGRAATLAELLWSVGEQLDEAAAGQVEICVSAGGARDGTGHVLAAAAERFAGLVRQRATPEDGGFAHHLFDAAELARGRWIWLMSSDDAIAPGGIAGALELVRAAEVSGIVGVSVGFEPRDHTLRRPSSYDVDFVFPPERQRARTYDDAERAVTELGVVMAYMASHLVLADAWRAAVGELRAQGGPRSVPFPHIEVFAAMLMNTPRWHWDGRALVLNRSGNESWTGRRFGGEPGRYWIAILSDLDDLWRRLAGPGARRANARTWLRWITAPDRLEELLRASRPRTRLLLARVLLQLPGGSAWQRLTVLRVLARPSLWR